MESNQNSTANKVCFIGKGKLSIFQNNELIELGNVLNLSTGIHADTWVSYLNNTILAYSDLTTKAMDCTIEFNNFNHGLKLFLSNRYLLSHSKLPGSTRTKRLRKKQISVLMDWWCKIDECDI